MLEILTDVLNYILNSCEFSKALILLRCVWRQFSTLPRRCQGFRRSGSRRRKRGKYQRRWRPFAKLSRWFRGWFLDALVILGGSAVLAVMFLSLAGF